MDLWKHFTQKNYGMVLKELRGAKFLLSEVEGENSQPAKGVFSSLGEYLCTLGLCAKVEEEMSERDQRRSFVTTIRVLELQPGSSKLMVLLKIPDSSLGEISPGDKATVHFTLDGKDEDAFWDLKFIESLPCSPAGFMTATMGRSPRGYSKSGSGGDSQYVPPTIPWPTGQDAAKTMSYITKNKGITCRIDTVPRHSSFPYIFLAFDELLLTGGIFKSHAVPNSLGAIQLKREPKYDIYSTLSDDKYISEGTSGLNDSQREAIRQGRAAPSGFVIAHGGPGTGKTHFVREAVRPFFLDKTKQHSILFTSANNRGADHMAESLHAELMSLIKQSLARKDGYVLRVHSVKSITSIFMNNAKKARQKKLGATARKPKTQPAQRSSQQRGLDAITTHCQTFAKEKFEGVDDERVQNIELSVGTYMKKMVGIEPTQPGENLPDIKGHAEAKILIDLYNRFSNGDHFDPGVSDAFDTGIEWLMGETIRNASAICGTVAGVVDSIVARSYSNAELIIVDEAARVPEYQWWPLLVFYPRAIGKIMVGDPDQLQPYVGKGQEKNPFTPQLALSLQSRLQSGGLPSAFFTTQYRALPEIASIYSNVSYGGRLKSDDSTQLARRPLAQDIRSLNKEKYGMEQNVVCFDIIAKERRDPTSKSRYCDQSVHHVMVVLENLLTADLKHCEIAILTPYKAQHKRLSYAKTAMAAKDYPKASEVVIETVDRVQGMEYDIVIIDPVFVRSLGFLNKNRLNVLFSRARCGLYIVGNYSEWVKICDRTPLVSSGTAHRDDTLALGKLLGELAKFRTRWPPSQSIYYHPDEFTNEADTDDDEEGGSSYTSFIRRGVRGLQF